MENYEDLKWGKIINCMNMTLLYKHKKIIKIYQNYMNIKKYLSKLYNMT